MHRRRNCTLNQLNPIDGRLSGRGEPGNGLLNLGFGERTRPETLCDVPVSDVDERFTTIRDAKPTGEMRRGEIACRTVVARTSCVVFRNEAFTIPRLWHIETEELCASGGDTADDERVQARSIVTLALDGPSCVSRNSCDPGVKFTRGGVSCPHVFRCRLPSRSSSGGHTPGATVDGGKTAGSRPGGKGVMDSGSGTGLGSSETQGAGASQAGAGGGSATHNMSNLAADPSCNVASRTSEEGVGGSTVREDGGQGDPQSDSPVGSVTASALPAALSALAASSGKLDEGTAGASQSSCLMRSSTATDCSGDT